MSRIMKRGTPWWPGYSNTPTPYSRYAPILFLCGKIILRRNYFQAAFAHLLVSNVVEHLRSAHWVTSKENKINGSFVFRLGAKPYQPDIKLQKSNLAFLNIYLLIGYNSAKN